MQSCNGCGKVDSEWFGDPWCEPCGGVMARPGFLIFRHVATVKPSEGKSVRVVYDYSSNSYKFRCNRVNPRYEEFVKNGGILTKDDLDFIPTPVLTKWNDELRVTLREAQIEAGDPAVIEFAATATPEERSLSDL